MGFNLAMRGVILEPKQALTLAALLIDFELESPAIQPTPPAWADELQQAKKTITELINRPDPGRFFMSAAARRVSQKTGA
jgi:hypothetical protein